MSMALGMSDEEGEGGALTKKAKGWDHLPGFPRRPTLDERGEKNGYEGQGVRP